MMMRLMAGSIIAITGGYIIGVAHSSYRHYYKRYADTEDLTQTGPIQEVIIVGEKE